MEAEGTPVFGPAPSSDAFAAEMEKLVKLKRSLESKIFIFCQSDICGGFELIIKLISNILNILGIL